MHSTAAAKPRRGAWRLPVLLSLAVLALASSARAASYYEANAPYRFGTGGASFGGGVDAATGAFRLRGQFASIPGRVPIVLKWGFNSHDNSDGPLGRGTSLSTDWFVAASAVLGAGYYELQAPGNRRYALSQSGGVYKNSTDPEVLGATLTFAAPPNGLTSTLRWKDGGKLFFNAAGELYRIEDRLGNYLTISRNANGYPVAITQPSGRAVTLSYGGNGKLASVTLPLSRTWQMLYDGSNRLTRVTDLNGFHSDYTWTTYTRSDGAVLPLVATVKDKRGFVQVTNGYDGSGRIATQTYNDGGILQATYSAAIGTNGYTSVTDPRNNVTRRDFTWTPSRFGYNIQSTTNALGRVTTYTRGGASYLITAVTDFRNRTVSSVWDHTRGNLLSVTKPTASGGTVTSSFAYETTFSQLTLATDPLNRQTSYVIDPTTGNLTSVTDPTNATTSYSYAANGDLLSVTNALSQITSMTYSAEGDVLTVTAPGPRTTSFGYDGASRKGSVTDANLKSVWFFYDAMDHLGVVTRLLNGSPVYTQFVYDEDGRRRFLIDGNWHFWETRYDTKGRVSLEVNPLGVVRNVYVYDLNDNLFVQQDAKGQQAVYVRGTGDRLTLGLFKRADGTTESSYSLTYSASTDLLTFVSDSGAGNFGFTYDALDRKIGESWSSGYLTIGYDDLGRRTSLTVPGWSPSPITYTYTARDQIASISQFGTTTFTHDALGRETQRVLPNGFWSNRAYNADGTLASITNPIETRLYQYDAVGNVTREDVPGNFFSAHVTS